MSDINQEKIRVLSKLCRIELADDEVNAISLDLNKIVDYAQQLQEVDTSDLPPYSHVEEQGIDSLREDIATTSLTREEFLANAPDQVGGMIRVPPVIKQNP